MLRSLSGDQVGKLVNLGRVMIEAPDALGLRNAVGPLLLDLFRADQFASFVFDAGATADGAPVIVNMDAANIQGLPVGFELDGPSSSDWRLLEIGLSVEKALGPIGEPSRK